MPVDPTTAPISVVRQLQPLGPNKMTSGHPDGGHQSWAGNSQEGASGTPQRSACGGGRGGCCRMLSGEPSPAWGPACRHSQSSRGSRARVGPRAWRAQPCLHRRGISAAAREVKDKPSPSHEAVTSNRARQRRLPSPTATQELSGFPLSPAQTPPGDAVRKATASRGVPRSRHHFPKKAS